MIPKLLHGYWSQGRSHAPEVVHRCWDAWQELNPDWELRILDAEEARGIFSEIGLRSVPRTHQAQSDIVRLWQIARQGGVYIDAATVPLAPLDDWLWGLVPSGFFGFHDPYRGRVIENWFLAATPGHALAESWLQLAIDYWQTERFPLQYPNELDKGPAGTASRIFGRVVRRLKPGIQFKKRIHEPKDRLWAVAHDGGAATDLHPYFWPHYLFGYLLETRPELRAAWASVPKWPSYKCLMIRHWRRGYASMTAEEALSLVRGAPMQKIALQKIPPEQVLDVLFSPQTVGLFRDQP